jgi:hypothetical protein
MNIKTQQKFINSKSPDPDNNHHNIIHSILNTNCLYETLGITKHANTAQIRRAYLLRSKICHPDRQRTHAGAKESFQRLSSAYQTLSEPASRHAYDLYGRQVDGNEQTFSDALSQVFAEFLAGHYDSLIKVVDYVQSLNADLKISKDSAKQIFESVRDFCLWSGKCWGAAEFEIINLVEIQQDLLSLSYFDVLGRLRLTVAMSKGFLKIPFLISDVDNPSTFNYDDDASSTSSSSSSDTNFYLPKRGNTSIPSTYHHDMSATTAFPLYNNTVFHRLIFRMITLLENSEVKIQKVEKWSSVGFFGFMVHTVDDDELEV